MLNCNRQNYHHSKLPAIGEIVHVVGLRMMDVDPARRAIVIAYPLCDNWQWYSKNAPAVPGRGIHTAYVRFLDNGEICRFAGQWLVDQFDYDEWRYHTSWAARTGLVSRRASR